MQNNAAGNNIVGVAAGLLGGGAPVPPAAGPAAGPEPAEPEDNEAQGDLLTVILTRYRLYKSILLCNVLICNVCRKWGRRKPWQQCGTGGQLDPNRVGQGCRGAHLGEGMSPLLFLMPARKHYLLWSTVSYTYCFCLLQLLGLDGSLVFLVSIFLAVSKFKEVINVADCTCLFQEHVFWVVSLNTLFILVFGKLELPERFISLSSALL